MSKYKSVEAPKLIETANEALKLLSNMTAKEALFVLLVMTNAVVGRGWQKEHDQKEVVDKFAASIKANLALNHSKGGMQ